MADLAQGVCHILCKIECLCKVTSEVLFILHIHFIVNRIIGSIKVTK